MFHCNSEASMQCSNLVYAYTYAETIDAIATNAANPRAIRLYLLIIKIPPEQSNQLWTRTRLTACLHLRTYAKDARE